MGWGSQCLRKECGSLLLSDVEQGWPYWEGELGQVCQEGGGSIAVSPLAPVNNVFLRVLVKKHTVKVLL